MAKISAAGSCAFNFCTLDGHSCCLQLFNNHSSLIAALQALVAAAQGGSAPAIAAAITAAQAVLSDPLPLQPSQSP